MFLDKCRGASECVNFAKLNTYVLQKLAITRKWTASAIWISFENTSTQMQTINHKTSVSRTEQSNHLRLSKITVPNEHLPNYCWSNLVCFLILIIILFWYHLLLWLEIQKPLVDRFMYTYLQIEGQSKGQKVKTTIPVFNKFS